MFSFGSALELIDNPALDVDRLDLTNSSNVVTFSVDGVDDYIAVLQGNPEIAAALDKGEDLSKYSAQIGGELDEAVLRSIGEYQAMVPNILKLHADLTATEQVFDTVVGTIEGYRASLTAIAKEMANLQLQTTEKNVELLNRRAAVELLEPCIDAVNVSQRHLSILEDTNHPLDGAFLAAVRTVGAVYSYLRSSDCKFPKHCPVSAEVGIAVSRACGKAGDRVAVFLAARLAGISASASNNHRIVAASLASHYAFAMEFVRVHLEWQHSRMLARHTEAMSLVLTSRIKSEWTSVKKHLVRVPALPLVIPKDAFDAKGMDRKTLSPAPDPPIPLELRCAALSALGIRGGELSVHPLFLHRSDPRVAFVDALARIFSVLASDVRSQTLFLNRFFGLSGPVLDSACAELLDTKYGVLPYIRHTFRNIRTDVTDAPDALIGLRIIDQVRQYCLGGFEDWEPPQGGVSIGRASVNFEQAGQGDACVPPPSSFLACLDWMFDKLRESYNAAVLSQAHCISAAVDLLSDNTGGGSEALPVEALSTLTLRGHLAVRRYASLAAAIHHANLLTASRSIHNTALSDNATASFSSASSLDAAPLDRWSQSSVDPLQSSCLGANVLPKSHAPSPYAGQKATDSEVTTERLIWSDTVLADVGNMTADILIFVDLLALRSRGAVEPQAVIRINNLSLLLDEFDRHTIPSTNSDYEAVSQRYQVQVITFTECLLQASPIYKMVQVMEGLPESAFSNLQKSAPSANAALFPAEVLSVLSELADTFFRSWSTAFDKAVERTVAYVTQPSARQDIFKRFVTRIYAANERLRRISLETTAHCPFQAKLVSNRRLGDEVQGKLTAVAN